MSARIANFLPYLATAAVFGLLAVSALANVDIRLIDPWVRAAPGGTKVTAAYMVLQNDGTTDDVLVSVTSPSVETVEIHATIEEDGVAKMKKLDKIKLPAGQKVAFAPGGYHLMLINLKDTTEIKRDWVTLNLKFEKSGNMEFKAPIRAITHQARSTDPTR